MNSGFPAGHGLDLSIDTTEGQSRLRPNELLRPAVASTCVGALSGAARKQCLSSLLAAFLFVGVAGAQTGSVSLTRGWGTIYLPHTGSLAARYIPPEVDLSEPQPLIVFLHGAGGNPGHYRPFVVEAAHSEGAIVVLPTSSTTLGWGLGNDLERVEESMEVMKLLLSVDPRRISISGHSAGGALAMILGFAPESTYSAVFQMSSPFVGISSLPDHRPPLRQYYGGKDPNASAARPLLNQQWQALGQLVEEQIEPTYGHSSWPDGTLEAGFRFLMAAELPEQVEPPPLETVCDGAIEVTDGDALCLLDRFLVTATWTDYSDRSGSARAVPVSSRDSGLLWFFGQNNWEMLVKMLDGCSVNERFWLYLAATTDVAYTVDVLDTATGTTRVYSNELGTAAPAITDIEAFVCAGLTSAS